MNIPYDTVNAEVVGARQLDDLDANRIQALFKASGALLFRGFNAGQEDFRKFSARFSSQFVTHLNFARKEYGDRSMTGVSPGNGHFFAHAEMGYVPFRPDVAWFYCGRPARSGGETTIYDGIEVLKHLKTETRRIFELKRVLFCSSIPQKVWVEIASDRHSLYQYLARFPAATFSFEFDSEQCLHTRYVTCAIVPTRYGAKSFCNSVLDSENPRFEDEASISKEILRDVIASSEQVSFPIRWQLGDVLMLDNSRFMHGRREFDDDQRMILVRFSNIIF